jgi:hypothetical protein
LTQVTDITVRLDPETGAATIELRGAVVAESRFRLRDVATEKFLTRRGWSKTPSFLPGEAVTAADFTVLALDPDLARRVTSGMNLSLEQPASNIFATLNWPSAVGAAPPSASPDDEKPEAEESLSDSDREMAEAAEADAAGLKDDGDTDEAVAPNDEPTSLEPSIRDEAPSPFTADPVPGASRGKPLAIAPLEDDDEDEDEPGTPWGKLAAAAVFFMVLGSLLTYFWQSSAYDNELRTAMRAVEAQRDQDRAELEKRLSEAETIAGTTTNESLTAAEAKVASLTSQTTELTKDRDAALAEVSEQQAKVKTLEERLSTAQGEIESLKAAAEADASEQSAVFNDRIEALGKELDAARTELERNRAEVATRDQTLAKTSEDLKKANREIATLRKSVQDQQAAQKDEIEGRVSSLAAQLDKATQDLAARDASLRDIQSKLSVANVQIEALKQIAGKAAEAELERTTLADRITELTGQLDKVDKELAAKEEELRKAKESAANVTSATDVTPQSEPETARLIQERDLYAKELSALTESFNALKAERDRLADAAGKVEQQTASLDTEGAVSESRAMWGATAIDQAGAIYSLQNQIAEKTATENVLALCRGKSNGRCEPLRTYSKSCFSLARIEGEGPRNDNFGFAVGKSWQAAESNAVRQCEELGANCTVRFTACSPDTLSKAAVDQ